MKYDVTVIGSGPGGYVAAIRCAQLGMKTALIEKYSALGGTCLNVGCIPSKALLDSSERFYDAKHKFGMHGIGLDNLRVDFGEMVAHKADVVQKTVDGVAYLMKKNKVDVIQGVASFINPSRLQVKGEGAPVEVDTAKVIIATGSKPSSLPFIQLDKKRVITSTEALSLKEIPKSLIIIGAGVIGAELGSVYARLGSKVDVVEFADAVIPSMDRTMGKELQRALSKTGIKFHLQHKVRSVLADADRVLVQAENATGGQLELEGDICLVAVGRKPYTSGLNLEAAGVALDNKERIVVDGNLETTAKGVYAIGDVIPGPMLAHKASEEGVFVAELLAGQKPQLNPLLIPNVVYTWPEVASVGYTEEELKAAGRAYKSGSFPFRANARARMNNDLEGLIKVIADKDTDEVLGVHMIGPRVGDIIGEAVTAMAFRAAAEDIARLSHAHPTFYESVKEASLAVDNRAMHS
ncbi:MULTISPECIES: dihydrolipoyl dehydrogenase [Pontibacter]|uniref:Dihydrolipoyl dehydrogenase n=1 Tax=Pontibacter actiniarum TaxID=323450 RepID=A0A1X9YZ11_9BACT|nr:dihydrolipoyl dehydrogenase [Pontibacter actiniarum]ARS38053.1 dihydrolipoyl dehydrogenase [Pontibacter actiniarum]